MGAIQLGLMPVLSMKSDLGSRSERDKASNTDMSHVDWMMGAMFPAADSFHVCGGAVCGRGNKHSNSFSENFGPSPGPFYSHIRLGQ